MIIVIYQFYLLNCTTSESFSNAEQSIGGVDDQNSINTLAQLARKLMDGGATIPGNLNFKGTTMPLNISSGTASPDAYKFQFGDGSGWRLRFQKDDKTPTMDVYDNGNVTVAGNIKAGTITSDGAIRIKNRWMIGGSGGGSGDDEWVRMTGLDNKGYYGGFAAGKLWTGDNTINGRNIFAEIDNINKRKIIILIGRFGPDTETTTTALNKFASIANSNGSFSFDYKVGQNRDGQWFDPRPYHQKDFSIGFKCGLDGDSQFRYIGGSADNQVVSIRC
jgi:hypothetical protein